MTDDDAKRKVHEAIGALLDDGEFAMSWVLTIDVAGPDDIRYLAHRAGGGADGTDSPMAWAALGMLRASAALAEEQVLSQTCDEHDEGGEDE
jgi:hypothetical protein